MEGVFIQTWMAIFWGSFENPRRSFFNLCPKNGGSCFSLFLNINYSLFGGSFEFPCLYLFFINYNNLNNIFYILIIHIYSITYSITNIYNEFKR
jgi:hypothetical protein